MQSLSVFDTATFYSYLWFAAWLKLITRLINTFTIMYWWLLGTFCFPGSLKQIIIKSPINILEHCRVNLAVENSRRVFLLREKMDVAMISYGVGLAKYIVNIRAG